MPLDYRWHFLRWTNCRPFLAGSLLSYILHQSNLFRPIRDTPNAVALEVYVSPFRVSFNSRHRTYDVSLVDLDGIATVVLTAYLKVSTTTKLK